MLENNLFVSQELIENYRVLSDLFQYTPSQLSESVVVPTTPTSQEEIVKVIINDPLFPSVQEPTTTLSLLVFSAFGIALLCKSKRN